MSKGQDVTKKGHGVILGKEGKLYVDEDGYLWIRNSDKDAFTPVKDKNGNGVKVRKYQMRPALLPLPEDAEISQKGK